MCKVLHQCCSHTHALYWGDRNKYSRIPLIWHPRDHIGAELPDIMDYQMVLILT